MKGMVTTPDQTLYHIYSEDNECIIHSLNKEEFEKRWSKLDKKKHSYETVRGHKDLLAGDDSY